MTIGEVQQMDVAETRHVVDVRCIPRRSATASEREACGGCRGEDFKEFAAIHVLLRRASLVLPAFITLWSLPLILVTERDSVVVLSKLESPLSRG
jgi:hypothetical protein